MNNIPSNSSLFEQHKDVIKSALERWYDPTGDERVKTIEYIDYDDEFISKLESYAIDGSQLSQPTNVPCCLGCTRTTARRPKPLPKPRPTRHLIAGTIHSQLQDVYAPLSLSKVVKSSQVKLFRFQWRSRINYRALASFGAP